MAAHLPPATGAGSPQSVESITRMAQDYEYNPSIPLRYWLRTASTLMREVGILLASLWWSDLTKMVARLAFTNAKSTKNRPTFYCFAMLS